MKLALTLAFLCCYVSVSVQQERRVIHPRALYVPLFYADGLPAGYDIIDSNKEEQFQAVHPRFLTNRFLSNFSLPSVPPIKVTNTITVAATSTLSTVGVVSCIPASQFAAGSTSVTCARRRRDAESLLIDPIQPSSPQMLEVSAMPAEAPHQPSAEIMSSKSEEVQHLPHLQVKNIFLSTTVVNVTVTKGTVYSFVNADVTSTKNLALAGALSCLPAGYIVCKP